MSRTLLLALAVANGLFAQADDAGRAERPIVNPPDIDFQIRTAEGQTVFRVGERIVIETLVSSRSPGKYRLSTGGCGSVPWNSSEKVSVEPPDAVSNAIHDNTVTLGGHVGSCMSGIMELTGEPFVTSIEMSPEMRFAHPGMYQIRVTSNRVSEGEDDGPWSTSPKIALISPPLPLTIVAPDSQWIAQEFSKAVQVLDADSLEEEKLVAVRTLRRLGTPEAVREMLRRIDGAGGLVDINLVFGLTNSPHESIVREGIEALITASDRPINAGLLEWLAAVEASRRQSAGELGANNPPAGLWKAISDVRRENLSRVGRSVMRKEPGARALSLAAILETQQFSVGPAGATRFADWEEFRPALADVFPQLPEDQQADLLAHQWPKVRHPNLLPHLLEIRRRPASSVADEGSARRRLRRAAIERIGDLDPSLGRRIVNEEVQKAELTIDVDALLHLPEERLPELDETLAERFAAPTEKFDMSAAARLIQRYATARIFEAVKEAYGEDNDQDCETQQSILAYFVRVEPEWAIGRIRRAVRYRPSLPTDCRETLLDEASRGFTHPELEAIAVDLLNDPEPVVAGRAAGWLGRERTETGRNALWERYSSWSTEWRGREEELRKINREVDFRLRPDTLEIALVQALRDSGDRYNHQERSRIRELCVTRGCLKLIADTR